MANIINQLEISGITYDIQDNDAQNTLLTKQDTLVSGVNIKTINNESLLGSGNIVIEGGTGDAYTKAETDALLADKADVSAVTNAIDAATSGKANSSDVYLKTETSSSTEINNALQAKADASTTYSKSETDAAINAATSGKADTSTVTSAVTEFSAALGNEIQRAQEAEQVLSGAIDTKADSAYVYLKTETSSSTQIAAALQAKADTATTYSKTEVDTAINAATSGKADADDVYTKTETNTLLNNKADVSAVTAEVNRAQGVEQALSGAIDGKQATLVSGTNIKTINNESLLGSGNITIQGGGANVVELTQAQYDALATKDPDTFYIISDAVEIDANNFYLKTQTSSSTQISDALAGKQNVLTAGTGIDITADVISVTGGGGGSSYTAGRGISISNDEISFSLPLSAGTGGGSIKCGEADDAIGSNSFAIGSSGVKAGGQSSFAGGSYSETKRVFSIAFGRYAVTNNYAEAGFGFFNNTNGSSTAAGGSSGNTLFSIGNGASSWQKHNALEIRQNGDIYYADTNNATYQNYYEKPMLKLQDVLADKQDTLIPGSGIDITNNVISVTGGGGGGTIDASLDASSPNAVANSAITEAVTSATAEFVNIYSALGRKQPMLTAGTGVDITDNVISVTGGGGTIDASLDANSPNAVANSAITAGIDARVMDVSYYFVNTESGVRILGKSYRSGTSTGIGFLSSINNKPIINDSFQTVNKFSLVETSAITTTLDSSSTDSQVPSAKAVYDIIGNINALLSAI